MNAKDISRIIQICCNKIQIENSVDNTRFIIKIFNTDLQEEPVMLSFINDQLPAKYYTDNHFSFDSLWKLMKEKNR